MAATPDPLKARSRAEPEVVRAVRTRPDRLVLTADGFPDAWIASDLCVDLRP